ncbi:type IV pilus biogenesis protein PilM [Burkholderia contaminans]|uniref:type IV pilus biogenesis protein PilM n=1 Tax=Burkholderia contaminans TaxID=488447 RepID=UPI001CF27312|nr:type IV pilus biogenesis protein PilM [Burkholderia contaminans]MCA7889025.1 type IV pilus biogenesis protein PilM [Burkholderia contaminans]
MYLLPFLIALLIYGGNILFQNQQTTAEQSQTSYTQVVAESMAMYRNYVVAYARANPGVTGTVPDTSLGLPAGFNKINIISNYAAGGLGYAYVTQAQTPAGLASTLQSNQSGDLFIGFKKNGVLVTPSGGTSPIALPAAIPDGSLVYATN